jgi:glycosyltransferase involved in cell wall biosynthesis
MKYETALHQYTETVTYPLYPAFEASIGRENVVLKMEEKLPEILFVTSYPPRECGIATYSQDLMKAMNQKFGNSFSLKVCALEAINTNLVYPKEVKYILNTSKSLEYTQLAHAINADAKIKFVLVQHEFGLFQEPSGDAFLQFLYTLNKPIVTVFHTVLPEPDVDLRLKVRQITAACQSIIVMTKNAAQILQNHYGVAPNKIVVIAHGTHLVPHLDKVVLKEKYGLTGRKVLSTFGLLGPGKGIETTLDALPAIVKENPNVAFLIIGKTHSGVVKEQGEQYRDSLKAKVQELKLQHHVKFINHYLPLDILLEYLQLTDIYTFTSKDPNQAVSGTFSYAMSCGCPIISTPIPHANEVLCPNTGIIIDFGSSEQLAKGVNLLLGDEPLRQSMSNNALQCIAPTAWENSAIAHAQLLQKIANKEQVC